MMYSDSTSRKLVLGKCSIIMGKEIYQANQVKEEWSQYVRCLLGEKFLSKNLIIIINCLFRKPT